MKKYTHTPGPWRYSGKYVFSNHSLYPIAEVGDIANWEANTRLIAAAPDLLEALKECLGFICASEMDIIQTIADAEQKDGLLTAIRLLKRKAIAAIAKAEGKVR